MACGVVSIIFPAATWAHGGGLDASGCHHNRKTGDYHCHRSTAQPAVTRAALAPGEAASPQALAPGHDRPATRPFANCAEARAAGAAPVRRGEPGYGPHLDRDNDGIGCEPYNRYR